jgi:hypothetical protein
MSEPEKDTSVVTLMIILFMIVVVIGVIFMMKKRATNTSTQNRIEQAQPHYEIHDGERDFVDMKEEPEVYVPEPEPIM